MMTNKALPIVLVILPGWNEKETISKCIASLKRQNYEHFTVCMILGGDEQRYVEQAKEIGWDRLVILDQTRPNKMKAYNQALETLNPGDLLLFSDMDCEFPDNFIASYVECFQDTRINIATGLLYPLKKNSGYLERYHHNQALRQAPKGRQAIHSLVVANFAMRKSFF